MSALQLIQNRTHIGRYDWKDTFHVQNADTQVTLCGRTLVEARRVDKPVATVHGPLRPYENACATCVQRLATDAAE